MKLKNKLRQLRTLLRGNAGLLVAINFLIGFVLWYGIEKIFLKQEFDIGAQGVGLMAVTYIVTALLFDVPSGVIADRWSRRYMVITAIGLFLVATILLGASTSYAMYLVATVVWGLYFVALSGTYESLTYDSLLEEGRAKDYQKVDAIQRISFILGIFISSAIGGFIGAWIGLRWTFFLSIIPLLVALICAYKLREPSKHKAITEQSLFQHGKQAIALIIRRKATFMIAALIVLMLIMQNFLFEYSQYFYLALFNDDVIVAAVLSGTSGLLLGVGYIFASRMKWFGWLLLACGILLAAASAWHSPWAILLFSAIYPLLAVLQNLTQTALQHSLPSGARTAATSSVNFLANCFIVPLTLLFAFGIDAYGAQTAYLYAAILFVVGGVPFVFIKHEDGVEPVVVPALADEFSTK